MGKYHGIELRRPSDSDIKVAIECLQNYCITDCHVTVHDLLEYTKCLEAVLDSLTRE